MAVRYKVNEINKLEGKNVFFDTNILIYLFWSTKRGYWADSTSKIYKELIKLKVKKIVDFNVISEFINRAHRMRYDEYKIEHSLVKDKNFKYKNYRDSQAGQEALLEIYSLVKSSILSEFDFLSKKLTMPDIESFLRLDNLDFIDKSISLLCKENNLVLLTSDQDFKDQDIDILSNNNKLFQ